MVASSTPIDKVPGGVLDDQSKNVVEKSGNTESLAHQHSKSRGRSMSQVMVYDHGRRKLEVRNRKDFGTWLHMKALILVARGD